jgi:hypothetical protein
LLMSIPLILWVHSGWILDIAKSKVVDWQMGSIVWNGALLPQLPGLYSAMIVTRVLPPNSFAE